MLVHARVEPEMLNVAAALVPVNAPLKRTLTDRVAVLPVAVNALFVMAKDGVVTATLVTMLRAYVPWADIVAVSTAIAKFTAPAKYAVLAKLPAATPVIDKPLLIVKVPTAVTAPETYSDTEVPVPPVVVTVHVPGPENVSEAKVETAAPK